VISVLSLIFAGFGFLMFKATIGYGNEMKRDWGLKLQAHLSENKDSPAHIDIDNMKLVKPLYVVSLNYLVVTFAVISVVFVFSCRINSYLWGVLPSVAFVVMTLVIITIRLVLVQIINARLEKFKNNSVRYEADIVKLDYNKLVRIGNMLTMCAVCVYTNSTGEQNTAKSNAFLLSPKVLHSKTSMKAIIYIDADNPNRYAIEVYVQHQ